MKNFDEAAEREAFDRWHETQRSSCPPSRAVLAEDAWLAAKKEAAEQQAQAPATYNEDIAHSFEKYMNKMGYGWNDFDRPYALESLIEQYAEARAQQGAPEPTKYKP